MFDFNEEDLFFGSRSGPDVISEYYKPSVLSSFGYIKNDLDDINKSFIRLGFHLAELKKNKSGWFYYLCYDNFYDAVESNFGLSRSTVSRLIDVYKRFSAVAGYTHTMFLDDKYVDYSYSQLVELLPLDDKEIARISPRMTIKEIREYKKQLKRNKKDKFQSDTSDKICDVAQDDISCVDVPETPVVCATSHKEDVLCEDVFEVPTECAASHSCGKHLSFSMILLQIIAFKQSMLDSDEDGDYFSGYVDALDDVKDFILENE